MVPKPIAELNKQLGVGCLVSKWESRFGKATVPLLVLLLLLLPSYVLFTIFIILPCIHFSWVGSRLGSAVIARATRLKAKETFGPKYLAASKFNIASILLRARKAYLASFTDFKVPCLKSETIGLWWFDFTDLATFRFSSVHVTLRLSEPLSGQNSDTLCFFQPVKLLDIYYLLLGMFPISEKFLCERPMHFSDRGRWKSLL